MIKSRYLPSVISWTAHRLRDLRSAPGRALKSNPPQARCQFRREMKANANKVSALSSEYRHANKKTTVGSSGDGGTFLMVAGARRHLYRTRVHYEREDVRNAHLCLSAAA